jgi:hypothetical protein
VDQGLRRAGVFSASPSTAPAAAFAPMSVIPPLSVSREAHASEPTSPETLPSLARER